jgi:hypothetical protein
MILMILAIVRTGVSRKYICTTLASDGIVITGRPFSTHGFVSVTLTIYCHPGKYAVFILTSVA